MTPKKKRSLKSLYLQHWVIPPTLFIASVYLSIAWSRSIIEQGIEVHEWLAVIWTAVMLPPILTSLGIFYAYRTNYRQSRDKIGAANALSFVASLFILFPLGLIQLFIGTSF